MSVLSAGILVALAFVTGVASTRPVIIEHRVNTTASGPTVVAIGDSIMKGHGLDAASAWPALLAERYGWRLTSLASNGSGFLTPGTRGDTFRDQIEAAEDLHPNVVIIAGSSNDLGDDDDTLDAATVSAITHLHRVLPATRIIAVSPVWGATALPAQLTTIDAEVNSAVAAIGGTSLEIGQPLAGHPELMQSDGVHPTRQGQQVLADAIAAALRASGITV